MKILLLTQWYPPEPQEFLAEMAQSLKALGHEVTVLTGFPNWPSGEVYPGYRIRPWQREIMDGIRVVRVALYPDHSRSGLKRALNYISFAVSAMMLGPWLVKRPDVIHAIPPLTVGIPAWLLSRLWRVPFTHEIQDIWPETLAATGMLNNQRALAYIGRFAKWLYKRASAIRVISLGFKANLIQKGVSPEKIHVISNWVDTDFYKPVERDPELSAKLGLAGRHNVMYAGAIGPAQGLDTVLEAAKLLVDVPQIQIVIVGDGIDRAHLEDLSRAYDLHNTIFLGRYPSEAMPGLYAQADVLLVHLRDDPLFRITIPHKVFTCLASGKPVLVAIEGDAAAVAKSAQAGLTCPSGDPKALADAIRRFYEMSPNDRHALGQNGRRAVCKDYGRDYLVEQIAIMLETVVAERRSPIGRIG